jgi:hypothetical protein
MRRHHNNNNNNNNNNRVRDLENEVEELKAQIEVLSCFSLISLELAIFLLLLLFFWPPFFHHVRRIFSPPGEDPQPSSLGEN